VTYLSHFVYIFLFQIFPIRQAKSPSLFDFVLEKEICSCSWLFFFVYFFLAHFALQASQSRFSRLIEFSRSSAHANFFLHSAFVFILFVSVRFCFFLKKTGALKVLERGREMGDKVERPSLATRVVCPLCLVIYLPLSLIVFTSMQ